MDTNPNNSESIIRKNILTKREKKLKNLLFKKPKKRRNKQPQAKKLQVEEPVKKMALQEPETLQVSPSEITGNIDNFMKDLSEHMQKANSEQISRQMLHDQNSLLRNHARILEDNQETLKVMMKNQKKKKSKEDYNSQRLVIAEMMKPFLSQVKEIKGLFEKSKQEALRVNKSLKKIKQEHKFNVEEEEEKKFPEVFGGYVGNQNKLRKKFEEAEHLAGFYKQKFQDLENFGADEYMKNLKKFNRELQELEQRSKDAQDEVEKRIHGINKRYNLMLPATYVDLIQKNINQIDFVKSKDVVSKKLGGELDYKNFKLEIEDVMDELEQYKIDFEINKRKTDMIIPEKLEKDFAEEYIKRIEQAPGILEGIKKKIEDFKSSLPVYKQMEKGGRDYLQNQQPGTKRNELIWNRHGGKKPQDNEPTVRRNKRRKPVSYMKPDYLRDIRTKPLSCKADVRYRKLQPEAEDYNTMFDVPEDHDLVDIKNQMEATDYDNWVKENPKRGRGKEERPVRLRYRTLKDQKNQTQKDVGVDTFSFQESNMATDAFLKAFGKVSRDSFAGGKVGKNSQSGFKRKQVENIISDNIKNLQEAGKLEREEEENIFLNSDRHPPKKQMEMYMDDVKGNTQKMIKKGEKSEKLGARNAIKFGLDTNFDYIKDHFNKIIPKKDETPFKNYTPMRYNDPFKNKKNQNQDVPHISTIKDSHISDHATTKKNFNRNQEIDDLADNIVNILNKALGKAAENPSLNQYRGNNLRPSSYRPRTPKIPSMAQSRNPTPVITPRPDETENDQELDLDKFYNNVASMNNAPKYVNQTDDLLQSESIADDLSQYLDQLRDTLEGKGGVSKVLDEGDSEGEIKFRKLGESKLEDEGEVKFGKYGDKQWLESENVRDDRIGDEEVREKKDVVNGDDKSDGEISFNHFSVDDEN